MSYARKTVGAAWVVLALLACSLATLLFSASYAWGVDSLQVSSANSMVLAAGGSVNADVEPNDTRDQAQAVSLGVTYRGDISSDDDSYDWYKVTLPSSGLLSVDSSTSYLTFYDEKGNDLFDLEYASSHRVTSGTYYLRFAYVENYSFTLSLESAQESFAEGQGGSNNSIGAASRINLGQTYRGQIALNDDVDYYAIDLAASGRVTISGTFFKDRTKLRLRNSGGSQIWTESVRRSTSSLHISGSWSVDLIAGRYYLEVGSDDWSDDVGTYSFAVSLANANESFPDSQSGSNNVIGSASPIELGRTYVSQLALNDSKDVFRFVTKGSGVVRITANSQLSDTTYLISDSFGDALASKAVEWDESTRRQSLSWTYNCGIGTRYFTVQRGSGSGSGASGDSDTGPVSFTVTELKSIANAVVTKTGSAVYTGSGVKPTISVSVGGKVLTLGRDYSVSFANNVNAGTAKVTVTGMGDYAGSKTATFQISKRSVSGVKVALASKAVFSGGRVKPRFNVTFGSMKLKLGRDYSVSFANNVNAGTAKVTVTGKGNYTGRKTARFKIAKRGISSAKVSKTSVATYTGSKVKPSFAVSIGGMKLKLGRDYSVSFANNVNAGTAKVTVTGKGNYVGSKSSKFTIKPKRITGAVVKKTSAAVYSGDRVEPTFRVTLGGKVLRRGVDYSPRFSGNINAGTAFVTIVGEGNYAGAVKSAFKIARANQRVKIVGEKWQVNSRYTEEKGQSVSAGKSYSCTIVEAHGKLSFSKVGADKLDGKFTVKKNGLIVVGPGTPNGVYRLKIKAHAAGDRNYKAGSTTFTTTIQVKYW